MGDHGPCAELAFSDDIGCKLCKYSPFHQQLFVRDDKQLTTGSKELAVFPLEDLDSSSDDEDLSCLVIEDFENLHVQDGYINRNDMQFSSADASGVQDIKSCGTVLCSEGENPCPSTIIEKAKMPTINLSAESSGDAILKHISDAVKPLSALKGSRAKQGMPLDRSMHVRWAPDVYDPPVTSSSHTVKGYQHRRPKVKKDNYKHKHTKGKSSKANSNDRRHSYRSSISSFIDPRIGRLQALAGGSRLTDFGQSKLQGVDVVAARHQESKCGGSFHMELSSSVPLPLPPLAEAS